MEGDHVKVRSQRAKKACPAGAVRPHPGAHGEVVDGSFRKPRHQCVAGVSALGVSGDDEVWVLLEWEVFGAVHGQVDLARDERSLERGHENALADRRVLRANVPVGDDRLHLHGRAAGAQTRRHDLALHQRQARPTSAQSKRSSRTHRQQSSLAAPRGWAPRRPRRRRPGSPACRSLPGRRCERCDPMGH